MLAGVLLVTKDRSSTCANLGKMEDLLEGFHRIKQKSGHINHKEEIDKSRFQNQQNSVTLLPPALSLLPLVFASLCILYLFSVIAKQLFQYCKNIDADSSLVLHLVTHITIGRQTLFP